MSTLVQRIFGNRRIGRAHSLKRRPFRAEMLEPRMLLSTAPTGVDDVLRLDGERPAMLDTLLDNDTHDGDRGIAPLSIVDFTPPDHGLLLDNDDGTLIYVPDAGFVGDDSFTYTISDGLGNVDDATVYLTIDASLTDMRGTELPDPFAPGIAGPIADPAYSTQSSKEPIARHLGKGVGTPTPGEILDTLDGSIPLSPAGIPLLHSLPSAPVAIYLDFDGWDWVEPYDVDGSPGTFNTAEQATIVGAWRDVATTYAMFHVDVTTEEPADFDLTPTNYEIIGNNISGGYSYLTFPSSRPRGFNQSGDARGRTTGISHEIGHNFGLRHQSDYDLFGEKIREYSRGDNDLHVPLMGVDFAGRFPMFLLGHPSSGPNRLQDDVAHVASRIVSQDPSSDGFRPDDFGGTIAEATALPVDGNTQSDAGIIEVLNDVDVFSFVADGGPLLVSARPDYPSAGDLKLEVYDALGTLLAAEDGPLNGQDLLLDLPAGTYYAMVSSHQDYADLGVYTIEARPLAEDWNTQDIGRISIAGYATSDDTGDTFTLGASGYDIDGSRDDFRYVYQPLFGDGQITARVASLENTHNWAKAGVMIRETLDPGARNVMVAVTPGRGVTAQSRSSTDGSTSNTTDSGHSAPYWVRLTRSGNSFTAERSSDGSTWQTVRSVDVTMTGHVYIGLALTSHDKKDLNVAILDNVSLSGTLAWPEPQTNNLPSPVGLALSLGVGTGIDFDWDEVDGATGYLVERSEDNINWTRIAATPAEQTAHSDPDPFGSMRYFYRVRARDRATESVPSDSATIANRPGAVADASVTSWKTDTTILNWTDVSGDTGYRIERSADGITFAQIATVGPNVPTYNDTGRPIATLAYYRISPMSPQGDGPSVIVSGSTRLAALTGLTFTSKAPDQLAFQWNPVQGADEYRIERSRDGEDFSYYATVSDATNYIDTNVGPVEEYYYRVFGVNENTRSQGMPTIFTATPWDSTWAIPWASQDVGNVGGSGAAKLVGGTYTQIGSGGDIWSSQDAFRFTYRPLEGDGQIIARVASLEDTDNWAKAGVMIRESLDPGARNVMARITPDHGIAVQWRKTTGGGSTDSTDIDVEAPQWLRLTRTGNSFAAEYSGDGLAWIAVGTAVVPMTETVYVGLAVTSHDNDLLNTTTFDNVTINFLGNTPPVAVDDLVTMAEDDQAAIPVLGNDTDADGHALSITAFDQGTHGSVTDPGDGSLVYTPAPGFVGTDTFGYTVSDGHQGYDTAIVTVNVLGLLYHWRLDETQGQIAADSKANADATLMGISGVPWTEGHYGGALEFDGTNDYLLAGADLSGPLGSTGSLAFWAKTTQLGGSVGSNAPGIAGVERAGSSNDIQWAWLDTSGRMRITVGNDDGATTADPVNDGQWHHVAFTRNAETGRTEVYVDGQPSNSAMAPAGAKTTAFSDIGRINDTGGSPRYFDGLLDDVRIYNRILTEDEVDLLANNGPPVALDDDRVTDEDVPIDIDVLANDTDPDDDPLSVAAILAPPTTGTTQINPDQTVTYTPGANWSGRDSFTYRITDGNGQFAAATVSILVQSTNDPPTAVDDAVYIDPNTAVVIDVLANDHDNDLDPIAIDGFGQAGHGTVVDNLDGSLAYRPEAGFVGTDHFTYTISDGQGGFGTATVVVGVGTQAQFFSAIDTYVQQNSPTKNNSRAVELNVDGEDGGGQVQALLRYDNIFGPGAGQIPEGSTIYSASLVLQVTNAGDPMKVHRMLRPWNDTDTWSSLGTGIQTDDAEAARAADTTTGSVSTGFLVLALTESLQQWSDNAGTNFGWAFMPTDTNGIDFDSAEGTTRPRLVVKYVEPPPVIAAEVVGRHVFYNNSAFDGKDVAVNAQDDNAIAVDKQALLPDQTASRDNYTNYARGINGIMIDIAGLADGVNLDANEDFQLKVGNSSAPDGWADAPEPAALLVRQRAGVDGSDRVTLVFNDNAVEKQWLQVTVLATASTGLAKPDVFYFGNAAGEAGDQTINTIVNATDEIAARNFQHGSLNPAAIDDRYDYNRDRLVDGTDQIIARNNQTNPLSMLRLITAPAADAVLGETPSLAPKGQQIDPVTADWLCEFDAINSRTRTSKDRSAAEIAVDALLASDWS
ncbi:MAG: Ig-like domain-containing protein [Thermoguttaceae bacterium]